MGNGNGAELPTWAGLPLQVKDNSHTGVYTLTLGPPTPPVMSPDYISLIL